MSNAMVRLAARKGYHIKGKEVIGTRGKALKLSFWGCDYPRVCVKNPENNVSYSFFVHKLVAYLKYGEKAFFRGVQVRHRDGDKMNFSESNILIGSGKQNANDIPKERRIKTALALAERKRKLSREQVVSLRERILAGDTSLGDLAKEYGIAKSGIFYVKTGHTYSTIK